MPDKKPTYDKQIMQEFLSEPGVLEKFAQMTPKEQDYFKQLLVKQGIYQRYVIERQRKQLRAAVRGE